MLAPEAPASSIKALKPGETQKETAPTGTSKLDKLAKTKPSSKTEAFGYIVTNQRYRESVL